MKKQRVGMSLNDIAILKDNLRYDPKTGEFFRKFHQSRPAAFCWANNNATIKVTGKDYAKYHSVWRAAVYFSHGYYPAFEDSIVFKDGNNANFRIDNLLVVHPSEDECTVMDFAIEHNLSPQTVNHRMKNADRYPRTIRNYTVYFYKKDLFMKNCGDLIGRRGKVIIDDEKIYNKPVVLNEAKRGNKLIRAFLKTHFLMPTRWELTLCN
jgi:hypothetical protein